jgi:hypothetical protein
MELVNNYYDYQDRNTIGPVLRLEIEEFQRWGIIRMYLWNQP